jgi:hypothetical protein
MKRISIGVAGVLACSALLAGDYTLVTFRKLQLTDQFWSEGAHYADINRDGHNDIISGPFWYEGPEFTRRHEYRPATTTFTRTVEGREEVVPGYEGGLGVRNAYSDHFFTWTYDFNADGWPDILVVGMPGENSFWFENPRGREGHWKRHLALDVPDNESPLFTDLTGDGRPELVCNSKGYFGYARPDPANPERPWTFHPISPNNNYHRYTHGIGVGDVNGDGRMDLLEMSGWWEQPSSLAGDPVWTYHAYPFCPPTTPDVPVGGAQMLVYDVNGDGLNDVITSIAAHGYGLAWYEQVRENGRITFKPHLFVNREPHENPYGVAFSQIHALDLVDIDGDGLKDFVTGKRFWAHGPEGDPEPNAPAVLYWFRLTRGADGTVAWVPHLVDNDSGVGTQVVAGDVTGNGLPDVVVGNKKGTFLFLQERQAVSREEWKRAQPVRR